MGKRILIDWTNTGLNNEYKKTIVDLESRIRTLPEGGTELSQGSTIGSLAAGEWLFDENNSQLYVRTTDSGDPNIKNMELLTYYLAYGDWATQAEMDDLELFQIFKPKANLYIRYIKVLIGRRNSPVFTDLKLQIHPEFNNSPTEKILAASTNVWANTDLSSNDGLAEIWFKFNDYGVKKDDLFCLVMRSSGSFDTTTHFAWLKRDSVYPDGLTDDLTEITSGGFDFKIIGREA